MFLSSNLFGTSSYVYDRDPITVYQLFINNRAKSRYLISFPFRSDFRFFNFVATNTSQYKSSLLIFSVLVLGEQPSMPNSSYKVHDFCKPYTSKM